MGVFLPGRDTSASRRLLIAAGSDDHPESFGLSRDGSRIAVSKVRRYSALMLADGVEGVAPSARQPQRNVK